MDLVCIEPQKKHVYETQDVRGIYVGTVHCVTGSSESGRGLCGEIHLKSGVKLARGCTHDGNLDSLRPDDGRIRELALGAPHSRV
jgi:hypothetical protein